MSENERPTFLQQLFDKKASVIETGHQTEKDVTGALREVDRQIQQALRGNPITGEGVTKSGKED
ncbi:MAG TPA: hypothetical protein VMW29_03515 [Candidatus Bathyarchaeia archaeon]|nr:hypothetical protein [Candidatus Bathyarchaeia archaeon]